MARTFASRFVRLALFGFALGLLLPAAPLSAADPEPAAASAAAPPATVETIPPGTELTFVGTVAEAVRGGEAPAPVKEFTLVVLVDQWDADAIRAWWAVSEQGSGRWGWSERFGEVRLDDPAAEPGNGPSLLFSTPEGKTVVPLAWPALVVPAGAKEGSKWERGGLAYDVERIVREGDRELLRVGVSNAYGRLRTLWTPHNSSLPTRLQQRVFMNMGTEFDLRLKLTDRKVLPAAEANAARDGFSSLVGLRKKASRGARSLKEEWTPEDLALLRQGWPEAKAKLAAPQLAAIAKAAEADLEAQGERAGELESLAKRYVGLPAPEFSVERVDGKPFTEKACEGKLTVLHFWTYRDTPLEEPYGQVGYLDYLYSRPHLKGVQFLGVAVDPRFADGAQRAAAVRSVRKFQQAMNPGYPLSYDDGSALARFGDPQKTGAELPLFVVVGPDGKVLHYHVGNYRVERHRGLLELDRLLTGALKAQADASKDAKAPSAK